MPYDSKEKALAYQRWYRQVHPNYNSERNKARRAPIALLMKLFKEGESCADCGKNFPAECMDWDHVRGEKEMKIGTNYTGSPEKLQKEVEKCELVCSNCHRIRTSRRRVHGR